MTQEPKSLQVQIGNWCRHFTGIQHERCKLGIAYKDVSVPQGRIPCLKDNGCSERCGSASFPTPEEVEQEVQRIAEQVRQLLKGATHE